MTPTPTQPSNMTYGYNVVSQQEVQVPKPGGGFTEGVRVTAQLSDGTQFSVMVPRAQYNVQAVKAMLDAQAKNVANIAGLSG